MANCKECYHTEVCSKHNRMVQIDEHTWEEYEQLDDVEKFCEHYKHTKNIVEVVRCKDCKHYRNKENSLVYDDDTCDILYYIDGTHRTACEQDFCSYGKLKEREG